MKLTFADSYYFLALLNPGDFGHDQAAAMSGGLLTTRWVLTEVGDACSDPTDRATFVEYLRLLESSPNVRIVDATNELFEHGIELFARRLDKAWSLTDCISFVVMTDLAVTDALTADQHFRQAGFNTLL